MASVFIDSNVLLHCKPLDELPWGDICEGETLILVSRQVQKEIDRLKRDGKSRRARRARKVSSKFRDILVAEDERIDLHHKQEIKLSMALAPPLKPIDPEDILDFEYADDRIVGEILAYTAANPEEKVILVTDDTHLCLTAKRCKLVYQPLPESWLLPAEPDERDRTISRLEAEVSELAATTPSLEIDVVPENAESWRVEILEYESLSQDRIGELRHEVADCFPMTEDFGVGSSLASLNFYRPPSDESIEKYQEEQYPGWLDRVEEFFRVFPSAIGKSSRCIELLFYLQNLGTVPAEHVVVEINALGGLLLAPPNERFESPTLPDPPDPPKRRSVGMMDSLSHFDPSSLLLNSRMPDIEPIRRDRFEFYWRESEPKRFRADWTFECEELRHQAKPEDFFVTLFVPEAYRNDRGSVEFKVSAKNLGNPVKKIVPITIARVPGSIEAELAKLLHKLKESEE